MKILKNKFFILGLILIFIFLILSVVFGYFYVRYYSDSSEKNEEIDEWEEYRNEELGYSIRHPKDFDSQGPNSYIFSVDIQENELDLNPKDWVENFEQTKIFSKKEVNIDNKKGYQITIFGYYCTMQQTYINHNKKMYTISFPTADNPNDSESEKHYSDYVKILDSFKFI